MPGEKTPNGNVMPERLLLKPELAEYLHVTERTIENQEKKGLPSVRIGKSVRYDLSDVLAWLKNPRAVPRRGRPRNIDRGRE